MTTKKNTKAKAMTLRQRMRADAEDELNGLVEKMKEAAIKVAGKKAINPFDLMRMCHGGQTKTVRTQLITDLTNGREAELEALYNKQQGLDLGEKNA